MNKKWRWHHPTRVDAHINTACVFFKIRIAWSCTSMMIKSPNSYVSIPLQSQLLIYLIQKKTSLPPYFLQERHSIWNSWRQWIILLLHAKWSLSDQFTMEVRCQRHNMILFLFLTLVALSLSPFLFNTKLIIETNSFGVFWYK